MAASDIVPQRSPLPDRIRRDIGGDPYYAQNFANDGERFLAWYLRNVHGRTPLQARSDITDGQDDKQIDALLVDDERLRVIIVQGKFFSSASVDQQPLQEILSAWCQVQNLPQLQDHANSRLRMKLDELSVAIDEDYEVDFELLTTGKLTK